MVSPTYLYRFMAFDIKTRSQLWPGEPSDDFVIPGRYETLEIQRETQSPNVELTVLLGVQQRACTGLEYQYFADASAANVF